MGWGADPMVSSSSLLFPGQGAQTIGMGMDFREKSSAAEAVFAEADAVLGFSLSEICAGGPEGSLTRTDIAQPAIFTTSMAVLAAWREISGDEGAPQSVAGLSLGEYTAMAAAQVVSFADGLRLVHLRGSAMQAASEAKPSQMTSVLGMEPSILAELCQQVQEETHAICQVANLNCPGQTVVSGELAALDVFEPLAIEKGARRAVRLQVAGAFHSEVMRPASDELQKALDTTHFSDASCPVWQNATAQPAQDAVTLKANLIAQLCEPVLWQDSFLGMYQAGHQGFLELAPGKVLAGLARKIEREAKVDTLDSAESLQSFLDSSS